MSDFLLDTHVILWLATDPDQIPKAVRHELENAEWIFVSSVSCYELSQKAYFDDLPGASGLLARWDTFVDRLMAQELALTSEEAIRAGNLNWQHRDPFDRLLVSQAQVNGLCLVTKDGAIRKYPDVMTIDWQ